MTTEETCRCETNAEFVARLRRRDLAMLCGTMTGLEWQTHQTFMALIELNEETLKKLDRKRAAQYEEKFKQEISEIRNELMKSDIAVHKAFLAKVNTFARDLLARLDKISFIDAQRQQLFERRQTKNAKLFDTLQKEKAEHCHDIIVKLTNERKALIAQH